MQPTGQKTYQYKVFTPSGTYLGLFSGKFDPLKGHQPYSVLAQALTQLSRGLLSLPEQDLTRWKARILERVSVNAGLIIDLAPEFERVLGPQPPVPETGLAEAQHRFDLTLARLLSVFASSDHPLVLFLDDLQRADVAQASGVRRDPSVAANKGK